MKLIIAANWKMHKNAAETAAFCREMRKDEELFKDVDVLICPPFTSLQTASEILKGSEIKLGAQNMYWEEGGAYTGEISADMLLDLGAQYVIIGHSERRAYFHEDDSFINKKVKKTLATGLNVILCVGETLEEREKGITNDVVKTQTNGSLQNVTEQELENVIIAYEPVWAIGTGKTATPEQAHEVHEYIRSLISQAYSSTAAERLIIQYGGSVKPDNAGELLAKPHIDGALVGGASLKADDFAGIVLA